MNFKENKGVTLLALTITIIVMLIISSIVIYNSKDRLGIERVNKLYRDIESINGKIDDYYLKYGEIPVLGQYDTSREELEELLEDNSSSRNSTLVKINDQIINPNDGDEYYVIYLEKLEGLTLNYGYDDDYKKAKDYTENITTDIDAVYIINKDTHQIYYPNGIVLNGAMYYSYNLNSVDITDKIPEVRDPKMILKGEFSSDSKKEYIDSNKDLAIIPAGFTVSNIDGETEIDTGLVIYRGEVTDWQSDTDNDGILDVHENYDQFVWIPVDNINTMYGTRKVTVDGTTQDVKSGKLYRFNTDGTISNYNWTEEEGVMNWGITDNAGSMREPDILTHTSDGDASEEDKKGIKLLSSIVKIEGDISTEEGRKQILSTWQNQLQTEFDEMIKYVEENKGFYVGRYETSLREDQDENGETIYIAQSISGIKSATAENEGTNTWYGLYQKEKQYSANNSLTNTVGSGMIWGSQYDQMMMWMHENGIDITLNTPIDGVSYNTTQITGSQNSDKLNNVFDLLGNSCEWTLESGYAKFRTSRGGKFDSSNYPSSRYTISPFNANPGYSSRITLYVK